MDDVNWNDIDSESDMDWVAASNSAAYFGNMETNGDAKTTENHVDVSETNETPSINDEKRVTSTAEETAKMTIENTATNAVENKAEITVAKTAEKTMEKMPENTTQNTPQNTPEKTTQNPPEKTIQKTSEKTPEKITEKTPEQTAEKKSEKIPEKTPGKTTEKTPEKISGKKTEKTPEKTTEKIQEKKQKNTASKTRENKVESIAENTVEKTAERKADKRADKRAEKTAHKRKEKRADKRKKKRADKRAEETADKRTDKRAETRTERTADKRSEKTVDKTREKTTEKTADNRTEKTADKGAEKRTEEKEKADEKREKKTADKTVEKQSNHSDSEDDIPLTKLRDNANENYLNTAILKIRQQIAKKKLENLLINKEQSDEDIDLDDTTNDATFTLTKDDINSSDSEGNDDAINMLETQVTTSEEEDYFPPLKIKKRKNKNNTEKDAIQQNKNSINVHNVDIAKERSLKHHREMVEAIDHDTVILERLLSSNNLVRIDIPSDGNCFFEAALLSVGKEYQIETAFQLRSKLCDHIAENREYYITFLPFEDNLSKDELFDQEVNFMRNDGRWTSNVCDIMPAALANFLQRGLTIYTSILGKPIIQIEPTLVNRNSQLQVLLALTSTPGLEHYHAVINILQSGYTFENKSINKEKTTAKKTPEKTPEKTQENLTTEKTPEKMLEKTIEKTPEETEENLTTEKMLEKTTEKMPEKTTEKTPEKTPQKIVENTAKSTAEKRAEDSACTPQKTQMSKPETRKMTPFKKANLNTPIKKQIQRKKVANPRIWKRNINKALKESGKEYISTSGKKIEAKKMTDKDCSKCLYKCSSKVSEESRQKLFSTYYNLSYERKKDFICQLVENKKTRSYIGENGQLEKKTRAVSRIFTLKTSSGENVRVCKKYFLATFAVGERYVEHALAHKVNGIYNSTENRGRHTPHNKTKKEAIDSVHKHIVSFPTVEAHYTRKNTNREFLGQGLSINKLYDLYKEKMAGCSEDIIVSKYVYRNIFNTSYNYSFHCPKKDQCHSCTKYNLAKVSNSLSEKTEDDYQKHQQRKERAREEKAKDKELAKADRTFHVATFDLEAVLTTPCTLVSQLYYKRKLCVYNLSIYDLSSQQGICYLWNETHGKRGSCEIATCVYQHLASLHPPTTRACMYSDTCTGQNRNQYMASMMCFAVRHTSLKVIEHKFLEPGHTHMECDSMHSAIEFAKKQTPIYVPSQWETVVHGARRKNPYSVVPLRYTDFWDFKTVSKSLLQNSKFDSEGGRVNWLKIVWIRVSKENPNVLHFKTSYDDAEFRKINLIVSKKRGRQTTPIIEQLPKLYGEKIPISKAKKKDLVSLCNDGVIPEDHHDYYNTLPSVEKNDTLAEPDVTEEYSDED